MLANSPQKSIFTIPADAKSTFRREIKFPKAISLEPVQSRTTFRPHFDLPNGVEKWPAAAQARVKLLLDICIFFAKNRFLVVPVDKNRLLV